MLPPSKKLISDITFYGPLVPLLLEPQEHFLSLGKLLLLPVLDLRQSFLEDLKVLHLQPNNTVLTPSQGLEVYMKNKEFPSPFVLDENKVEMLENS